MFRFFRCGALGRACVGQDRNCGALDGPRKRVTAWNSASAPFGLADQFDNDSLMAAQFVTAQTEEARRSQQVAAFRAAEIVLQKAKHDQQTAQTELDRTKSEITQQKALTTQAQAQLPALETTLTEHRKTCLTEQAAFGQWVAPFGQVATELAAVPALLGELSSVTCLSSAGSATTVTRTRRRLSIPSTGCRS
jgi:hypothetical protein